MPPKHPARPILDVIIAGRKRLLAMCSLKSGSKTKSGQFGLFPKTVAQFIPKNVTSNTSWLWKMGSILARIARPKSGAGVSGHKLLDEGHILHPHCFTLLITEQVSVQVMVVLNAASFMRCRDISGSGRNEWPTFLGMSFSSLFEPESWCSGSCLCFDKDMKMAGLKES